MADRTSEKRLGRNWLLARAEQTPDAPAIESDGDVLTFARLAVQARRAAEFVLATASSHGARSGQAPLALLLPGDARFAAWFHGIALAGRTVLPLNLRLTAGEIAEQLMSAGVGWLLGEAGDPRLDDLQARVSELQAHHAVDPATSPSSPGSPPAARRELPGETCDRNSTLAVLLTSGTAGRARGACLTYGNFLTSAEAAADRLGPAVTERWLCCMPLFHVGGLSILVRSVLYGGPVRLQPRFDAAALSDALDRDDIAGVSLVPTMLSRLLAHRGNRPAPSSLRVLLLGGAAAAPALVALALDAGYPVCPTYGLTEATSQVATAAPPSPVARGRSATPVVRGPTAQQPMRAVQGVELRIVSDGRELAAGEPGEILVRGPVVMRGYLNDTDATARVLRNGWLHTGDIGYLDAAGGLHVLDRRDDLVITGGENVYPAEVESVLLEHPAVADAGVAGVPDDDLGARVVAWIVCRPGDAPDAAALAGHCAARLARFKQPREFRFVDALPRNASGKLQRRRLASSAVGS